MGKTKAALHTCQLPSRQHSPGIHSLLTLYNLYTTYTKAVSHVLSALLLTLNKETCVPQHKARLAVFCFYGFSGSARTFICTSFCPFLLLFARACWAALTQRIITRWVAFWHELHSMTYTTYTLCRLCDMPPHNVDWSALKMRAWRSVPCFSIQTSNSAPMWHPLATV